MRPIRSYVRRFLKSLLTLHAVKAVLVDVRENRPVHATAHSTAWLSLEGSGFLPAVIPALLLAAVRPWKFPVFASSRRPPSILTINRTLAERLAVLIDIW